MEKKLELNRTYQFGEKSQKPSENTAFQKSGIFGWFLGFFSKLVRTIELKRTYQFGEKSQQPSENTPFQKSGIFGWFLGSFNNLRRQRHFFQPVKRKCTQFSTRILYIICSFLP